jgi:hypothetical protein
MLQEPGRFLQRGLYPTVLDIHFRREYVGRRQSPHPSLTLTPVFNVFTVRTSSLVHGKLRVRPAARRTQVPPIKRHSNLEQASVKALQPIVRFIACQTLKKASGKSTCCTAEHPIKTRQVEEDLIRRSNHASGPRHDSLFRRPSRPSPAIRVRRAGGPPYGPELNPSQASQ